MKKQYFVRYPRNFANEYSLVWSDSPATIAALADAGYERISRREAIALCCAERDRRRYDAAASGYASDYIAPADLDPEASYELWCRSDAIFDGPGRYILLGRRSKR